MKVGCGVDNDLPDLLDKIYDSSIQHTGGVS